MLLPLQHVHESNWHTPDSVHLLPGRAFVWTDEQGKLLEELHDQTLDLAGDGRCDSSDYCAKYLTYSLHLPGINKILHLEQVQVGELAVNHLYCCAVASRDDPDLLVRAWTSMTGHVVDIHTDHPGIYAQCLHDPDRDDPQQGDALWEGMNGESSSTPMHGELRAAAGSGEDETCIATLHWNENANREQAIIQAGQLQFKVKSPKARKGHHTANPEKTKATQGNRENPTLVV
ncbi:hypothetical protein HPB47_006967 [Ixodes persulcatus]|uniref:Uncharacterized protein n=1 Tax=Ixodes persulcatus TaxID=34615 RepID=A0AC60P9B0_IXOPE|nr:hypothetical protein HPB47_006967 [Ixodes persulcatus]